MLQNTTRFYIPPCLPEPCTE